MCPTVTSDSSCPQPDTSFYQLPPPLWTELVRAIGETGKPPQVTLRFCTLRCHRAPHPAEAPHTSRGSSFLSRLVLPPLFCIVTTDSTGCPASCRSLQSLSIAPTGRTLLSDRHQDTSAEPHCPSLTSRTKSGVLSAARTAPRSFTPDFPLRLLLRVCMTDRVGVGGPTTPCPRFLGHPPSASLRHLGKLGKFCSSSKAEFACCLLGTHSRAPGRFGVLSFHGCHGNTAKLGPLETKVWVPFVVC